VIASIVGVITAGDAWAGAEPHLAGTWQGFAVSALPAIQRGAVTVHIRTQDGRRVTGEACFPPDPCVPVSGVVSGSHQVSLRGTSSETRHIIIDWKLSRPSASDGAFIATGSYRTFDADGVKDHGVAALVQHAPDADAASLTNTWSGTTAHDGVTQPVMGAFRQDSSGAIASVSAWSWGEMKMTFVGQVSGDAARGVLQLVGACIGEDGQPEPNGELVTATLDYAATTAAPHLAGPYSTIMIVGNRATSEMGTVELDAA
jgi:hypothetical protein